MEKIPTPLINMDLLPVESTSGSLDPLRPGSPCPSCEKGRLDYNGLLELECVRCGTVFGSSSACT